VQGVADISGSPYAQVGRAYYDLKGPNLAGRNMGLFDRPTVHIDPGSKGTHLTEWNIFELLAEEAIREKAAGTNIAYLLFTAPSILVDGYATEFCGFHSVLQMGDATGVFVIPVAFVGWGGRNCQFTNPVPGNRVVQGTMLILWHELEEIVTDPHFDAWFDIGGAEISDLCAWTTDEVVFEGDVVHNFRAANGNTYLLQALFVPDGTDTAAFPDGGLARTGYCGMRWPGKVPVEQTVRIENLTYGMQCLAATGGLGSRIVGRPCQAEEAQKFVLVRDGQGALSIKSLYSALPVGLWGGDLVSLAGGARTLWGISRPDSEGNVDFTPLIEHDTNLTMINGGAIQSRPVAPMGQQSWRIIPWN
jgi:hypothetical protein